MSTISVIIPNYNRASLVGATIDNMLRQSVPPTEVIVVDDGSTDDSVKIIRSFGSRVVLIEQTNQGPGAARNAGFAASTGSLVQFMDSDDMASLNKLDVQSAAIRETGADFAYCPWVRTRIQGTAMQFTGPVMQGGPLPDWRPMLEWQLGPWCLVFQNCLFQRTILEKAGRFRTDLMPSEDSEYLVRILLAGARPVFTANCLVFYRVHASNQITSSGTAAAEMVADSSRYLEVVGSEVQELLHGMHRNTRQEIALYVYRHIRLCRAHGWPEPRADSAFCRLTSSVQKWRLVMADWFDRISRKLTRLPSYTPNSRGLMLRDYHQHDWQLAKAAGFDVVKS